MIEIIEKMRNKNSTRGTAGRKIVVADFYRTMNFQTEVLQSEFLVVTIILRTLHHLLQIELGKFLQPYPQSCSIHPIFYGPHNHDSVHATHFFQLMFFIPDIDSLTVPSERSKEKKEMTINCNC